MTVIPIYLITLLDAPKLHYSTAVLLHGICSVPKRGANSLVPPTVIYYVARHTRMYYASTRLRIALYYFEIYVVNSVKTYPLSQSFLDLILSGDVFFDL